LQQFPHRALFYFASLKGGPIGSEYLEHAILVQACVAEWATCGGRTAALIAAPGSTMS
jgi:hypothetical protein